MTCFTAEEIWEAMPHRSGENAESVMLTNYPEVNEAYDNKDIEAKWDKLIKLKDDVAKQLELARADKTIGSSLQAKVTLFAEEQEYEFLKGKEELLKLIFIVSDVEISGNRRNEDTEVKVGIKVELAEGEKCERCWMYSKTVGEDKENPTICHRCSEAIK